MWRGDCRGVSEQIALLCDWISILLPREEHRALRPNPQFVGLRDRVRGTLHRSFMGSTQSQSLRIRAPLGLLDESVDRYRFAIRGHAALMLLQRRFAGFRA